MTVPLILEFVFLAILLGFSAFFSGSETALFSLSRVSVERLRQKHPPRGQMIFRLLSNPRRLLISIVVGNMLVNIFSSSLAERISAHLFFYSSLRYLAWVFSAVVMTFLILIFGEVIPKMIAINRASGFSLKVAPAILVLDALVSPLRKVIRFISDRAVMILDKKRPPFEAPLTKEELDTAIRLGTHEGTLNGEEREMIAEVFRLGDKSVKQLMTPRTEIVSFEVDTDFSEIAPLIREKEYSRIPIYSGKKENVIGILYPKDLILARARGVEKIELGNFLRRPYFIPPTMEASRLLREFLKKKIHIALVVDEYGGLSGLITLDDLIEEIVGEIRERGEPPLDYETVDENTVRVRGRMELEHINERLGLGLSSEESVTLGGFLCERLGHIPQAGETYREGKVRFEVVNLKGNRIGQVLIKRAGIGSLRRKKEEGNKT